MSLSLSGPGSTPAPAQTAQQRPNIILLVSDDTGYGDLGPYGGGVGRGMPTPNIDRMANEAACPITVADFSKPAPERLLFGAVEPDDTPDTQAGEAAIRAAIAHLHDRLLGERVSVNDPEVDRTLALFEEIRDVRIRERKTTYLPWPAYCALDFDSGDYIDRDPQHTIRAWIAVLNYMLGDYRFVHE